MNKSQSIFVKVLGGFLLLSFIGAAITVFGILRIGILNNDSTSIVGTYLPLFEKTTNISENCVREVAAIRGYVITKDTTFKDTYTQLKQDNDTTIQNLIDTSVTAKGKQLSRDVQQLHNTYAQIVANDLLPAISSKDDKKVLSIMSSKMVPAAAALTNKLTEYKTFRETQIKTVVQNSSNDATQAKSVMSILLAVFLLVAVSTSIILARMIVKPVRQLQNSLAGAAKNNDLTVSFAIRAKDEIGQMGDTLNDFISRIRTSFSVVADHSREVDDSILTVSGGVTNLNSLIEDISATTEQLSAGAEETAASAEEINASIEEINSSVQLIAQRAQEGAVTASDISEKAVQMKTEFSDAQGKATIIFGSVKEKLEKALEGSKEVEQINVLADAILEITSQTNLLALNASIEAARAGDAGRGFAVVANEIGKLADDSSKTAGQIQNISEVVRSSVKKLSESADDILKFVSVDVQNDYQKMLTTTDEYSKSANEISDMISDFSSTTEELLASIEDISDAVSGVAQSASESAKGSTNIATRTGECAKEAGDVSEASDAAKEKVADLLKAIGIFKI